mgnify:CR=1 FL=1
MKLIADWRRVVALSLSFWAQVLGLLALILPELAYALWGAETDPYFLWWLGVFLSLFGIAGRLVEQTGSVLHNQARIWAVALLILLVSALAARAQPATEAETLAIAVPFIAEKEGLRLEAYLDIVGVPTICAGSTRGVQLGQRKTRAECLALLRAEAAQYRAGLRPYLTAETLRLRLPPPRDAAFTSLAYNIGIAAAGGSTALRRLNAGNVPGACDAITWWTKAGGRVIRGLVIRRADERALCLREG